VYLGAPRLGEQIEYIRLAILDHKHGLVGG
jgi:hypothetical protein